LKVGVMVVGWNRMQDKMIEPGSRCDERELQSMNCGFLRNQTDALTKPNSFASQSTDPLSLIPTVSTLVLDRSTRDNWERRRKNKVRDVENWRRKKPFRGRFEYSIVCYKNHDDNSSEQIFNHKHTRHTWALPSQSNQLHYFPHSGPATLGLGFRVSGPIPVAVVLTVPC
jgi:hypothetical protein